MTQKQQKDYVQNRVLAFIESMKALGFKDGQEMADELLVLTQEYAMGRLTMAQVEQRIDVMAQRMTEELDARDENSESEYDTLSKVMSITVLNTVEKWYHAHTHETMPDDAVALTRSVVDALNLHGFMVSVHEQARKSLDEQEIGGFIGVAMDTMLEQMAESLGTTMWIQQRTEAELRKQLDDLLDVDRFTRRCLRIMKSRR